LGTQTPTEWAFRLLQVEDIHLKLLHGSTEGRPNMIVTPILQEESFDHLIDDIHTGNFPFAYRSEDTEYKGLTGVSIILPMWAAWEINFPDQSDSKKKKNRKNVRTGEVFEVNYNRPDGDVPLSTVMSCSSFRIILLWEPHYYFPPTNEILVNEARIDALLSSTEGDGVQVP